MTRVSTLLRRIEKNIKELKQEHPEIDDGYLLDMVKMYIWLNKRGDKE